MNETTKIFKKNLDINVQDFVYSTALDLKVEEESYDKCFTCGNWAGEVIVLKNVGNNDYPAKIRVGLSCADYFELPNNASALLLAVQRSAERKAQEEYWAKNRAEFFVKEPQLAQMGEFLSTKNDYYARKFNNVKYDVQDSYIEWLRELTLDMWQTEVDKLVNEFRFENATQLENGLQEVTGKVINIYFAETQWGSQERIVLDVNANTLFVNVTKALDEVNINDTITIELEISMFDTDTNGEFVDKTLKGMGKAGRRKLINHIKA